MNLNQFLALPIEQRRKTHVRRKPRGQYKCRPNRSPDELIDYLRQNKIHSVRQLRKLRKPDDPHLNDYRVIGNWAKVKEQAFGKHSPFDLPQRPTVNYIINSIADMDLWTREAYEKKRNEYPDLIVSPYWIRHLFGSWDKAKYFAEQGSIRRFLESWLRVYRRLGKTPTMAELDQYGISLEPLKRVHKTRAELNDFLERFSRVADKLKSDTQDNFSDMQQAI